MHSHCLQDVGMKLLFMPGYYMSQTAWKCFSYIPYSQSLTLFVLGIVILIYIDEKMSPERLTDLFKAPQVVRSPSGIETQSWLI